MVILTWVFLCLHIVRSEPQYPDDPNDPGFPDDPNDPTSPPYPPKKEYLPDGRHAEPQYPDDPNDPGFPDDPNDPTSPPYPPKKEYLPDGRYAEPQYIDNSDDLFPDGLNDAPYLREPEYQPIRRRIERHYPDDTNYRIPEDDQDNQIISPYPPKSRSSYSNEYDPNVSDEPNRSDAVDLNKDYMSNEDTTNTRRFLPNKNYSVVVKQKLRIHKPKKVNVSRIVRTKIKRTRPVVHNVVKTRHYKKLRPKNSQVYKIYTGGKRGNKLINLTVVDTDSGSEENSKKVKTKKYFDSVATVESDESYEKGYKNVYESKIKYQPNYNDLELWKKRNKLALNHENLDIAVVHPELINYGKVDSWEGRYKNKQSNSNYKAKDGKYNGGYIKKESIGHVPLSHENIVFPNPASGSEEESHFVDIRYGTPLQNSDQIEEIAGAMTGTEKFQLHDSYVPKTYEEETEITYPKYDGSGLLYFPQLRSHKTEVRPPDYLVQQLLNRVSPNLNIYEEEKVKLIPFQDRLKIHEVVTEAAPEYDVTHYLYQDVKKARESEEESSDSDEQASAEIQHQWELNSTVNDYPSEVNEFSKRLQEVQQFLNQYKGNNAVPLTGNKVDTDLDKDSSVTTSSKSNKILHKNLYSVRESSDDKDLYKYKEISPLDEVDNSHILLISKTRQNDRGSFNSNPSLNESPLNDLEDVLYTDGRESRSKGEEGNLNLLLTGITRQNDDSDTTASNPSLRSPSKNLNDVLYIESRENGPIDEGDNTTILLFGETIQNDDDLTKSSNNTVIELSSYKKDDSGDKLRTLDTLANVSINEEDLSVIPLVAYARQEDLSESDSNENESNPVSGSVSTDEVNTTETLPVTEESVDDETHFVELSRTKLESEEVIPDLSEELVTPSPADGHVTYTEYVEDLTDNLGQDYTTKQPIPDLYSLENDYSDRQPFEVAYLPGTFPIKTDVRQSYRQDQDYTTKQPVPALYAFEQDYTTKQPVPVPYSLEQDYTTKQPIPALYSLEQDYTTKQPVPAPYSYEQDYTTKQPGRALFSFEQDYTTKQPVPVPYSLEQDYTTKQPVPALYSFEQDYTTKQPVHVPYSLEQDYTTKKPVPALYSFQQDYTTKQPVPALYSLEQDYTTKQPVPALYSFEQDYTTKQPVPALFSFEQDYATKQPVPGPYSLEQDYATEQPMSYAGLFDDKVLPTKPNVRQSFKPQAYESDEVIAVKKVPALAVFESKYIPVYSSEENNVAAEVSTEKDTKLSLSLANTLDSSSSSDTYERSKKQKNKAQRTQNRNDVLKHWTHYYDEDDEDDSESDEVTTKRPTVENQNAPVTKVSSADGFDDKRGPKRQPLFLPVPISLSSGSVEESDKVPQTDQDAALVKLCKLAKNNLKNLRVLVATTYGLNTDTAEENDLITIVYILGKLNEARATKRPVEKLVDDFLINLQRLAILRKLLCHNIDTEHTYDEVSDEVTDVNNDLHIMNLLKGYFEKTGQNLTSYYDRHYPNVKIEGQEWGVDRKPAKHPSPGRIGQDRWQVNPLDQEVIVTDWSKYPGSLSFVPKTDKPTTISPSEMLNKLLGMYKAPTHAPVTVPPPRVETTVYPYFLQVVATTPLPYVNLNHTYELPGTNYEYDYTTMTPLINDYLHDNLPTHYDYNNLEPIDVSHNVYDTDVLTESSLYEDTTAVPFEDWETTPIPSVDINHYVDIDQNVDNYVDLNEHINQNNYVDFNHDGDLSHHTNNNNNLDLTHQQSNLNYDEHIVPTAGAYIDYDANEGQTPSPIESSNIFNSEHHLPANDESNVASTPEPFGIDGASSAEYEELLEELKHFTTDIHHGLDNHGIKRPPMVTEWDWRKPGKRFKHFFLTLNGKKLMLKPGAENDNHHKINIEGVLHKVDLEIIVKVAHHDSVDHAPVDDNLRTLLEERDRVNEAIVTEYIWGEIHKLRSAYVDERSINKYVHVLATTLLPDLFKKLQKCQTDSLYKLRQARKKFRNKLPKHIANLTI